MTSPARRVAGDIAAVLRAHWYLRRATETGPRIRVWGRPMVVADGELRIGDRVKVSSNVATTELAAGPHGVLSIGSRSLINFGCSIVAMEKVEIGERCLIGPHCMIMDTGFHQVDPARRLDPPTSEPITIGANVWLGARVIVLPGITIGENSVVGIGSVVTRDIPPNTVFVGNPARHVRDL